MKKQIFLVDLVGDVEGHYFMMQALQKIENTICIDTKERKILVRKKPLSGIFERTRIYIRVFKEIKSKQTGAAVVHFLTGDKFFFLPILISPQNQKLKVLLTLHRFPKNKILQILLKNFANKINNIIVFSDLLKEQCNSIGINNVISYPYPTFQDYSKVDKKEVLRIKYNLRQKDIVITSLGGTRYEKGLDILLESFKYISIENRNKIILNIAGREQDILKNDILKLAHENKIRLRLDLKSLSDLEFCENVILSDIVVMPYRKTFNSAASGPMTEAMSQGIPCIFPRTGSLRYYETKYKIGRSFITENPKSLAEEIEKMISGDYEFDNSFKNSLSTENFILNHKNLYNKVINDL